MAPSITKRATPTITNFGESHRERQLTSPSEKWDKIHKMKIARRDDVDGMRERENQRFMIPSMEEDGRIDENDEKWR